MQESRQLLREELQQNRLDYRKELHGLLREVSTLRADYCLLATKYHRVMLDRAVDEAVNEKSAHPGMLMN
jgi:hypothetical protein